MGVKRTVSFLVFFFFLLLFYTNYLAVSVLAKDVLLSDDFEGSLDKWNVISGEWSQQIEAGGNKVYRTESLSKEIWNLTIPKDESLYDLGDYSITVEVMSGNGVDQLILFRLSEFLNSFYSVDLRAYGWTDSDNVRVGKTVEGNLIWDDELGPSQIGCHIENNEWYGIKINVKERDIDLRIKCPDEDNYRQIYSRTDDASYLSNGTIGLASWSGHWNSDTTKYFDNLEMSPNSEISKKHPIIVLPGLGASWNTEAILLGETSNQSEWSMTPFVKEYENLTKTLENAGYIKGDDLFVFNYDWRQPVDDISSELGVFIDNNLNSEDELVLVGHSLGGLVARDYWQDNNEKVDKVVTLGSPHQGVVMAYEALAGGKIDEKFGWGSVAANMLTLLRAPKYITIAETLRSEIASLYDLSPTFDFLYKGRRLIPSSSLFYKNDWLGSLNSLMPDSDVIHYISGDTGENVTGQVLVKSQTAIDKMLGLWPDGVPYRYKNGPGDETVLLKSSFLGSDPENVFGVSHRELPSDPEVIASVLETLGIESPAYSEEDIFPIDNSLIFLVASPVNMTVAGPGGPYLADGQGIIAIANPEKGEYRATLNKTGEGRYHLIVGRLFGNSKWNYYEGVASSEGSEYIFSIDPDNNKDNPLVENESDRLRAVLEEIRSLKVSYFSPFLIACESDIISASNSFDSGDYLQTTEFVKSSINNLFNFRKSAENIEPINESWRSVSILADVYSSLLEKSLGTTKNEASAQYKKAAKKYSLSWRKIRLLDRRSSLDSHLLIEYRQGEDLLELSKQYLRSGSYSTAFSYSYCSEQNFR